MNYNVTIFRYETTRHRYETSIAVDSEIGKEHAIAKVKTWLEQNTSEDECWKEDDDQECLAQDDEYVAEAGDPQDANIVLGPDEIAQAAEE